MQATVYAAEAADEHAEEIREYSLNDFFFDTVVSIRFEAAQNGEKLLQRCRDLCADIEHTFSRTDEESELYAVNHRKKDRVRVSRALAQLVQTGLDYCALSEGRFDITVAPLSDLWDFKSGDAVVPSEAEIQSALRKVDASAVHVESGERGEDADDAETEPDDRDEPGEDMESSEPDAAEDEERVWYLCFDRPDTMIDLGALVKGYAADRLSEYLKGNGVSSGLINLGGNVLAIGAKPDGSAWRIGIQKPFESDIVDTVEIEDMSVVTSGVYERCFEKDGVLYHHILDPETGYPVQNGLWGVSIISDSSLTGDALSTVCMLLGENEAKDLIRETDGVRAIFVDDALHTSYAGE